MNDIVNAIIEIPLKTKNKFEIDEKTKKIKLDRVLYSAMNYPAEYGYVEEIYAYDKDPLDILVISSEPTIPGCIVPARIIGYLEVIDNGFEDFKLISVVAVDPRYNEIHDLSDLSEFTLAEIKDFFENYKTLQKIKVIVKDYHSKQEALDMIKLCQNRYILKNNLQESQITDIIITPNDNQDEKEKATCKIEYNNGLILDNVKIIQTPDKLTIALKKDLFEDIKLTKEFLKNLENKVIKKYSETIN